MTSNTNNRRNSNKRNNSKKGNQALEGFYNVITKGVGYINSLKWYTNEDGIDSLIGQIVLLVGPKKNYTTLLYNFLAVGDCIDQLDELIDEIEDARDNNIGVFGTFDLADPEPNSYIDDETEDIIYFTEAKLIKIRFLKIEDNIFIKEDKNDDNYEEDGKSSRTSNRNSRNKDSNEDSSHKRSHSSNQKRNNTGSSSKKDKYSRS